MAHLHLAPASGALNDPTGIWLDDTGRYHVVFQHNPAGLNPLPEGPGSGPKEWAHAVSDDLLHWSHRDPILVPTPGWYDEDGCWSGSMLFDDSEPLIFYTGVRRTATGWTETICEATVSSGAKRRIDVAIAPVGSDHFRDPHVSRRGDITTMLIGGGTSNGGLITVLTRRDGDDWSDPAPFFDARAARRAGAPDRITNAVWECPQLVWIDGHPVLIVSVDHGTPRPVAYFVGSAGRTGFEPTSWGFLDVGGDFYAVHAASPDDGPPMLLGWIHQPDMTAPTGGHLSIPRRLTLVGDELRSSFAPTPEALRRAAGLVDRPLRRHDHSSGSVTVLEANLEIIDDVAEHEARAWALQIVANTQVVDIDVDLGHASATVARSGAQTRIALDGPTCRVLVVVDGPIVEFEIDGRCGALDLGPSVRVHEVTASTSSAVDVLGSIGTRTRGRS